MGSLRVRGMRMKGQKRRGLFGLGVFAALGIALALGLVFALQSIASNAQTRKETVLGIQVTQAQTPPVTAPATISSPSSV